MEVKEIHTNTIKLPDHLLRSKELLGDINSLAQSIKEHGLLHPIVVTPDWNKYLLIAGYRRLQAWKKITKKPIPANIIEVGEDKRDYLTLIENTQRHEVNPYDEAVYFQYLYKEKGLDQTIIASMIGKTQAYVSYKLSLLNLDDITLGALVTESINELQARELGRCKDIPTRQYLLDIVAKDGATGEVIRRWVDQYQGVEIKEPVPMPPLTPGHEFETSPFKGEVCDFCGSGVESGGLQAMMACPDCYLRIKAVMSPETEKTTP